MAVLANCSHIELYEIRRGYNKRRIYSIRLAWSSKCILVSLIKQDLMHFFQLDQTGLCAFCSAWSNRAYVLWLAWSNRALCIMVSWMKQGL